MLALLRRVLFTASLLSLLCAAALAQAPVAASKLLPERLGDFRAADAVTQTDAAPRGAAPQDYGINSAAVRHYRSADGSTYVVLVAQTASTSAAYSLLAERDIKGGEGEPGAGRVDLGSAEAVSRVTRDSVAFVKGPVYVSVSAAAKLVGPEGKLPASDAITAVARALADSIDASTDDQLPVLVMHLPDWEKKVREGVGYAVSPAALQRAAGNLPELEAVPFDGGTEAVIARYGEARLVIVEFPTPQHSVDADAAIKARLEALRASGQPTTAAYKRVGNYSVFAFGAADEDAAGQLISGVKYEKDVRWLGRNPHAEEIATRRYTSTMGGVLLTTLITTGLAILLCLGVGAVVGGAVFLRRRAQQAEKEVYSDAGGMLRLNIEDLNTPPPSSKLIGQGED